MTVVNPFITQGYLSPHYFCDRIEETKYLGALKPVGHGDRHLTLAKRVKCLSP